MQGSVKIGGHRGMGCTDHSFYQKSRDILSLPVENTTESILAAFDAGADYIETDAVMSGDGVLFILHNVVPKDHFFADAMPPDSLNKMRFSDITRFTTGRHENGRVCSLAEVLKGIAGVDPKTGDFAINIEIKGVQGSGQPYEANDFLQKLAVEVKSSPLALDRVLFSSFSLANIIGMSHLLPAARYGMLFADRPESRPIYADRQDDIECRYLPFDVTHIDRVFGIWQEKAQGAAKLSYLHPEIATMNADTIGAAAGRGCGINCWALFEEFDQARADLYLNKASACQKAGVPFTIITDYIPALQKALERKAA